MSHTKTPQELLAHIKDLEKQIKQLKNRKKFGLVWEDKPEEVVSICETHIPILKEVKNRKLVLGNELPANILIEGDNYHSLSVLNYTHRNKIDVIYIDPPYNTGSSAWIYNNNYIDENDSYIFRDTDTDEHLPDYIKINEKYLLKNNAKLPASQSLIKNDLVSVQCRSFWSQKYDYSLLAIHFLLG